MYLIYPKDKEIEAKVYDYHKEGGLPLEVLFFDLENVCFGMKKYFQNPTNLSIITL
jgi:hypothetical protein